MLSFANGLTRTSNTVLLGGTITGTTLLSGAFPFTIDNTGTSTGLVFNGFNIRNLSSTSIFKTAGTNGYIWNSANDALNLMKLYNNGTLVLNTKTTPTPFDANVGLSVVGLTTSNTTKEAFAEFYKYTTNRTGITFYAKEGTSYIQSSTGINQNVDLVMGAYSSTGILRETLKLTGKDSVKIKPGGLNGTAGQALVTDGFGNASWATVGGGTPAGSNTQIQFNNAGSFGASADLTTTLTPSSFASINIGSSISNGSTVTLSGSSTINGLTFGGSSGTQLPAVIEINTATSGNGKDFTIEAGSSVASSSTGGDLYFVTSTGTSNNGNIIIQTNRFGTGGYIIMTGLPTTCAGAPTGALANVAGVLTICP